VLCVLVLQFALAQDPREQWSTLNSQAKNANDEASATRLASTIRQQFPWVPTEEWSAIQGRLVRAELRYRAGERRGVAEGQVLAALNHLSAALKLPAYASSSRKQVHYVRVASNAIVPELVKLNEGKQDDPDAGLSPLGAVYVALVLVEQKLNNPDFQIAPDEWDAKEYQRRMDAWQARRNGQPPPPAGPHSRFEPSSPQAGDLRRTIRDSLSSMDAAERDDLIPNFLSTLGLD
jgi:hypothetical protein